MKICFKCHKAKERTEFYGHPQMGDGLLGKCKECTKADALATRLAKIEHYRSYDRARASEPHRRAQAKRIGELWRKRHPARKYAHTQLRRAILAGLVVKEPCRLCGDKAEAHHPNYDSPLDVVWLCPAHHKQAHALVRKAA